MSDERTPIYDSVRGEPVQPAPTQPDDDEAEESTEDTDPGTPKGSGSHPV